MRKIFSFIFILTLINMNYAKAEESTDEGKLFMEPVGTSAAGYFYIEGKPGEHHEISLKITNTSSEFKGSGTLFISDAITGKGGGMATMTPELATREKTAKWFPFFKKEIELQPGKFRTEKVPFTIPKDATPGDHIANAVMYKFVPSKETSTETKKNEAKIIVNNAYSQSYAIWVKIAGKEVHELVITKLNSTWNGADLFLDVHFLNKGNVLEKSNGTITIYKNNKRIMEHKGVMDSIYPDNSAIYSFPVNEEAKQPGKYKVEVAWSYGKEKIKKELSYEIERKETKRAEDIVVKGEEIKPEGFYITKEDLIKYGLIALGGILIIFAIVILIKKKRQK